MPIEQTRISTKDVECPAHVLTPSGAGPWPAIIFYMDAGRIQPAMIKMAHRFADAGYVVLLPDLFYRMALTVRLSPRTCSRGTWERSSGR